MAISYRQRGKKKLWDYRVFDNKKKVIASNSGFRTKKEAQIEALAFEMKVKNGVVVDREVTLYQLWKKWFTLYILPQNKRQSTLRKHEVRGKKLQEYFQDTPISQIKSSAYQEFINYYAERNAKDTMRRLNKEVQKVVQFAQRDRLNIDDFTEAVIVTGRPPKKTIKEKYIGSLSDYGKILCYLESILNYRKSVIPYLLYVQFKTGMRFGEVLGLTWDCVLYETKEIKTYRRYDNIYHCWAPPKTDTSVRVVPVDEDTLQVLLQLEREQKFYLTELGLTNPEKFLFLGLFYGIPTNNGVNKYLRSVLQKLEIKPDNMTATGIRHTYISVMLSQNIDIWTLAKNVGHKDIKQITETYGHLIAEKEEKENDLIRQSLQRLKEYGGG
ncbi:site-specific integrase [Streptococcus sanguinis]|uniref:tyrosine-type recombinase/integrase n=1 Tax=Streptococcus sanguinis TaxID=1305 RepID=UPI0031B5F4A8